LSPRTDSNPARSAAAQTRPQAILRDLTDPGRSMYTDDLEAGLKEPLYENIIIPELFGPIAVHIDLAKARRFAFTQGLDSSTVSGLPDGGPAPVTVPSTIVANDLLQLFTTKYAASKVVGLHTEEELSFLRPVSLGQDVTLEGQYVETYERRGQGHVVMEAEARDLDGAVLVRHRGTEIMRTTPGLVAGRSTASPPRERRVTGEVDGAQPAVVTLGADAATGMPLAPAVVTVSVEQAAVYSRIGEFVRNIHNSLDAARDAGLALPIVQGQQLACHVAHLLANRFGAGWYSGGWMRVRFLKPVTVLDEVTVAGVVHEVEPGSGGTRVNVDVWISSSAGLHVVGWARCTVPAHRRSAFLA